MKKINFKINFILILISASVSCETSENTNVDNGIGYYWEQTKCSDPWGTTEADSNSVVISALKNYLNDNGVPKVEVIDFDNTLSDGEITCDACHCPTGVRIIMEVPGNQSGKMEGLGFAKF